MTKLHRVWLLTLAVIGFGMCAANGMGQTIPGVTYAISNGFTTDGTHPEGSHLHSSNRDDLPPDNPTIPITGAAEVGGFFGDEEVRGVSEFDLTGQSSAIQATLEFDVMDVTDIGGNPIGGLFGQDAYEGMLDVFAYRGDNIESLTDYEVSPSPPTPIATIDAAVLTANQTLEFDVTDLYNSLILDLSNDPDTAAEALGIRLQMAAPANPDAGAITFDDFQLDLTIPEPSTGILTWLGLCSAWLCFRRLLGPSRGG